MIHFCINLNVHYSAPQEVWDKIESVYVSMPHWAGFTDGYPKWSGDDGKLIEASVEPSGLQLSGSLPQKEWNDWLKLIKNRLTSVLDYPIGELEDGYEFKFWEQ